MAIEKFRFVSPGVQINEIDDSVVQQQPPATGPVVIGNTAKGPAMQPVLVSSVAELERVFGAPSNGNVGSADVWRSGVPTSPTLATYAAKAFLQNSTPVTVMRLAGVEVATGQSENPGWETDNVTRIFASSSDNSVLVANIYHNDTTVVTAEYVADNKFGLTIGSTIYTASLDRNSNDFIRNKLNTNPTKYSAVGYFLGESFENATGSFTAVDYSSVGNTDTFKNSGGATSAATGYVVDDKASAEGAYNRLFRFVGLNNGSSLAKEIKISIENVRESRNKNVTKYGTFDVVVRRLFETQSQSVLERFAGVNLDINSTDYIVKRIGDSNRYFDVNTRRYVEEGSYPNRSSYVRVEMAEDTNMSDTSLPHGFEAPAMPIFDEGTHPDIVLSSTSVTYTAGKSKRFGLETRNPTNNNEYADLVDILSYKEFGDAALKFHTREISSSIGDSTLQYVEGYYQEGVDVLTNITNVSGSILGFDIPLYGGFDAKDITKAEPFINNDVLSGQTEATGPAYRAIKNAIDLVSQPEVVDMNVLSIPGLQNQSLTNHMLDVCRERGDALALIDLEGDYLYPYEANNNGKEKRPAAVNAADGVISKLNGRNIDNSYGAAYFPAVFVPSEGIFMPASVAALGAIGGTEGRQGLWFAPAGFNRGGLSIANSGLGVSRTALSLVASDRDDLYSVNINPIATFPNEGVVIFGQKTLQVTPSALDRVNVRRLLNYIKKQISRVATRILFEPNVESTWNSFKNIVEPFLLAIKNAYGLDDARVVLDPTTTTADLVDRNMMYCKIYIKPTRAIEYIAIDFVVTNSGAAFTENQ